MLPRAVRNNNPGNLDKAGTHTNHWQGLMPEDKMTPDQKMEPRFAVFESPAWGFRALIEVLKTYYEVHGLRTIDQIISRWAPPTENDTDAYAQDVAARTRWSRVEPLPYPACLGPLAKAITMHESGSWEPYWHDADLASGLKLLGLS